MVPELALATTSRPPKKLIIMDKTRSVAPSIPIAGIACKFRAIFLLILQFSSSNANVLRLFP